MFVTLVILCVFASPAVSQLTFRNVMVTCDSEQPLDDDIPFGTIVTTNKLKPHLPSTDCFKIAIQYATIHTLYQDALSDITNANYLFLENDNIEEIEPGAFKNVKLKEALSLQSNNIKEIRRGVFNDVQVPVLILSYNLIAYIDYHAFDNMTLKSIHLDHNKLPRINPFWFRHTPKLIKLNFQHNLIEQVPEFAFQMEKLNAPRIDLSHNQIREVSGDAFANTKRLDFLSLAFNRLESLERNWLKGVKVNVLDISHNRLRCLRDELAGPFSTNFIDKNPWSCGCLQDMKSKESTVFGSIVADEAFRRCNI
ncbi:hypothetical protein Zmor_027985 [Zophobas morio]|uniref:Uncharacterized protein n=1 Tax=Zophobas morio TaxID=2755281 RepID=A0AA38HP63_9CUCU|nr:hypothetical protein Zmor_027985 [Zophobas morio]